MSTTYDFLVDTYDTERLKTLSVWSMFGDDDLAIRPRETDERGRNAREQMIHQCMSENLWFIKMLDIDVEGTLKVKRLYSDDALTIFIQPPSLEVLAERLRRRNTETETSLRHRLERARHELTYADRFDAIVVNDDLKHAIDETICLIRSFLQPRMDAEGGG